MNSHHRLKKKHFVPLALSWSHIGVAYRVTPWPEARFERRYGDEWIPALVPDAAMASAAQSCGPLEWRPYLEFVPTDVREFLLKFSFMRMEALQVAARCPALVTVLAETPALTGFVASHVSLRGTEQPSWCEINAVFERGEIFSVLEWLGLPASRQTMTILGNITEPDLPKRFLEPLRSLLWEPQAIFALQRVPALNDRQLARFCHALAA